MADKKYIEAIWVHDGKEHEIRIHENSFDSPVDILKNGKWERSIAKAGFFHTIYPKK